MRLGLRKMASITSGTSLRWLLFFACLTMTRCASDDWEPPGIGVTYGGVIASSAATDMQVVLQTVTDKGGDNWIPMMRLTTVLNYTFVKGLASAMGSSREMQLMVAVPDDTVPSIAADVDQAKFWIFNNVQPLMVGGIKVRWIVVGTTPIRNWTSDQFNPYIYPAIRNLNDALVAFTYTGFVKVTVDFDFGIVQNWDPPSGAHFRDDFFIFMAPILKLLQDTSSRFMISVEPFMAAIESPVVPAIEWLMFRYIVGRHDPASSLFYTNLFQLMVDAVYTSLAAQNYTSMGLIIGEVGWPALGDPLATVELAQEFNQGVINFCNSGIGTPLRPGRQLACFIRSVTDENLTPRSNGTHEPYWGLLTPGGTSKYALDFTGSKGAPEVKPLKKQWCITKADVTDKALRKPLNFLCGEGGADCQPINVSGPCYQPATDLNHARFVYNDYYQRQGQIQQACDFAGTAQVIVYDPSVGSCNYTIGTTLLRDGLPLFTGNMTSHANPRRHSIATRTLFLFAMCLLMCHVRF